MALNLSLASCRPPKVLTMTTRVLVPTARRRQGKPRRNRGMMPIGMVPSAGPTRFRMPVIQPTADGLDYSRTYLNPNGKYHGGKTSPFPTDGSVKRSGAFKIHETFTLSRPEPFTDDNWSLFVYSTNGLFIHHICVATPGSSDELSPEAEVALEYYFNADISSPVFNQWTQTSQGDAGIYILIHVPPELLRFVDNSAVAEFTVNDEFVRVRQTYKGDTYRYVGSTLTNAGSVVCGKYPTASDVLSLTTAPRATKNQAVKVLDRTPVGDDHPLNPETGETPAKHVDRVDGRIAARGARVTPRATRPLEPERVYRFTLFNTPFFTSKGITAADPSCYVGTARDGVYSVNYLNTDNCPWHDSAEARWLLMVDAIGPTVGYDYTPGGSTSGSRLRFKDIICNEWETGVVIFTAIEATSSIQLETRVGLEFVSQPSGDYSSLQMDAPIYDPRSAEVNKRIAMVMRSGYPASYNDWGKLWNIIKGVIPSAVGLIPGVGGFLQQLAPGAIRTVEDWVTGPRTREVIQTIPVPATNVPGRRRRR